MTTTITTAYHVAQGGASLTTLQAEVAAVPVPPEIINVFGLRITSDLTTIGSGEVVRNIVFSMIPSPAGSATADIDSDGRLRGMTVTAAGEYYAQPPVISFTGSMITPPKARAGLKVIATDIDSGGSGYTANAKAVLIGGAPVPPAPAVSAIPGGEPNFVPAQLGLTISGGVITVVTVVTPGRGYSGYPLVQIIDTVGSGAEITVSMGISNFEIDYEGEGLVAPVSVVLTPIFQSMFPAGSNQGAPVNMLMLTALQAAVKSPIVASAPVVT